MMMSKTNLKATNVTNDLKDEKLVDDFLKAHICFR